MLLGSHEHLRVKLNLEHASFGLKYFFLCKTLWDNSFQITLKEDGHDTRMQKSGGLGDGLSAIHYYF